MKLKSALALAAFCLSFNLCAAPATDASIEELLNLTQAQSTLDAAHAQLEQVMKDGMNQALQGQRMNPKQQAAVDKLPARMAKIIREEVTWEKMKPQLMVVYRDIFTQEEINGLIDFYKTPTGQTMTRKMPQVLQKSVQISQNMMMQVMPKMQQLMQETVDEIRAAGENENAGKEKSGKNRK